MNKYMRLLVSAALLTVAATALAKNPNTGNVHFNDDPEFADEGVTLSISGTLYGLGSGDIEIVLSGTGDTETTCTSPGGNEAPGQNPGSADVQGTLSIPEGEITNGHVDFALVTQPPADPSGKQGGCPNNRWDAEIIDVAFETATIEVFQGGSLVLRETFEL